MAARSGAGTGVVVGLVVFVLSTIFLLVLTIVFYSKYTKAEEERVSAGNDLNQYVSSTERASDRFKAILDSSQRSGSRSAMGYMINQQEQIMGKVLGNTSAGVDDLNSRLASYAPETPNATYADVLSRMAGDLRSARNEAQSYQDQITEMQRILNERDQLLQQAQQDKEAEVQAVRDMIATFMEDVQRYGTDVADTKAAMMRSLQELENTFDAQVDQLERTIDNLRADMAQKDTRLAQVQGIIDQLRMRTQNPSMLVDASILDNASSDGIVFIDRGRSDHVTLGMTFEVYDSPEMIRVDEFGNMPRGKASLQVIKVGEQTSTAKITRESRGRPVVRGDVLANAVYDPEKEFMFMVHGKFDLNGDGRPSEAEADQVRSLINDWGGTVVDGSDVRGDLDFLVLGVQPNRPLDLPENPTDIQVSIWVDQNQAYQSYNDLLNDAMKAGIPVLNQNRFLILIGHTNN